MPIGMKIMYAHSARIYAYGVGYGVAVWNERQYQSLCKRNSKIAVPLFCLYKRNTIKDPLFYMFIHPRLPRHSTDPILSR